MRKLLLVVVLCLVLPASAEASAGLTPLELASRDAVKFWASEPCGGRFHVRVDAEPGADAGLATAGNCTAHLSERMFGRVRQQEQEWPLFCATVVHEVGHLILGSTFYAKTDPLNPAHSTNEHNIMHPMLWGVLPSTCFPATFTMPDGNRIRWTIGTELTCEAALGGREECHTEVEGAVSLRSLRGRYGHFHTYGGYQFFVEKPSEARNQ